MTDDHRPARLIEDADVTQTPHLAAERYQLLVAQLKEELGEKHGWKSKAAEMLGVTRSYVGHIDSGAREGGGVQAVRSAIKNLRLKPEFFYEEYPGDPHYKNFIADEGSGEVEEYPGLRDFMATAIGQSMNEDEYMFLRSYRKRPGQTPDFDVYYFLLQAVRSGATREQGARGAERTAAAVKAARARDAKPRTGRSGRKDRSTEDE